MRYFMQAPICKRTKECDLYLYELGRDWDLKLVLLVFLSLALSLVLSLARARHFSHTRAVFRARVLSLSPSFSLSSSSVVFSPSWSILFSTDSFAHTYAHTHRNHPSTGYHHSRTLIHGTIETNFTFITAHVTMLFSAFQEQVLSLTHSLHFLTHARSLSRVLFPTFLCWEEQKKFESFCH